MRCTPTEYSWPAQQGATLYEVARSPHPDFAADCLKYTTSDTFWVDDEDLPAGAILHYLSRPLQPNPGSWGADSTESERDSVCP